MSVTFYDLMKYAKTSISSSEMTAFDKMKALAFFGGGKQPKTKSYVYSGTDSNVYQCSDGKLYSWKGAR